MNESITLLWLFNYLWTSDILFLADNIFFFFYFYLYPYYDS